MGIFLVGTRNFCACIITTSPQIVPPKCVLPIHTNSIIQPLHTVHTGHISATFSVSIYCACRADVVPRIPRGQHPLHRTMAILDARLAMAGPKHSERKTLFGLAITSQKKLVLMSTDKGKQNFLTPTHIARESVFWQNCCHSVVHCSNHWAVLSLAQLRTCIYKTWELLALRDSSRRERTKLDIRETGVDTRLSFRRKGRREGGRT